VVMQLPSRPISLLLVCHSWNEGNLLRIGVEEALGDLLSRVELKTDVRQAFEAYKENHPDVVIACGFESGFSEALTINIRKLDGKRHTGIIVMAPVDENVDHTVANNYHAGADDVISSNTSLAILRSKLITVFNHKVAADELRAAIHKLATMSLTDELTGLANMRGFLKKFAQSVQRCSQGKGGLAVLMIDLDHFKRINDSMNHLVGSHVIKSVGQIIGRSEHLGNEDYAARYGGDEYIVVLHGDDYQRLILRADEIRKSIVSGEFRFQGFVASVTCSVGLCFVESCFKGSSEDIVKEADSQLYKSKEKGRNQVSAKKLGDSVNLDHVRRTNLVDGDAGSNDNRVSGVNHSKAL